MTSAKMGGECPSVDRDKRSPVDRCALVWIAKPLGEVLRTNASEMGTTGTAWLTLMDWSGWDRVWVRRSACWVGLLVMIWPLCGVWMIELWAIARLLGHLPVVDEFSGDVSFG